MVDTDGTDAAIPAPQTSMHSYLVLKELKKMVYHSVVESSGEVEFGNLENLLKASPSSLFDEVGFQIVISLVYIMEKRVASAREKELISFCHCLEILLDYSKFSDFQSVNRFLLLMIKCLKRFQNSEDIVNLVLNIISRTFQNVNNNDTLVDNFYDYSKLPLIAVLLQTILTFLNPENKLYKVSSIQLRSMRCIVCMLDANNPRLTLQASYRRSHIFASLFPGIASALFKLIMNSSDHKFSVISEALITLGNFFLIIFHKANMPSKGGTSQCLVEGVKIPDNLAQMLVTQNEEWKDKVNLHFEKFLTAVQGLLMNHNSDKIRIETILFCRKLLVHCGTALNLDCVYLLLWTVLCLENDTFAEVKDLAISSRTFLLDQNQSLVDNADLKLKFFDEFSKLSRELGKQTTLDSNVLLSTTLTRIVACLSILDSRTCFKLPSLMYPLLDSMTNCLRVEINSIQVLESRTDDWETTDDRTCSNVIHADKFELGIRFENLSMTNLKQLERISSLILTEDSFESVIEYLGRDINESPDSLSRLALLGLIIDSLSSDKFRDVKMVINVFCERQISKAATLFYSPVSKHLTAYFIVSLDIVKASCRALKEDLNLKEILYDVAIFATHSVSLVASTAMKTLYAMTEVFCGTKKPIAVLIEESSDYLFSSCVIKLKNVSLFPEVISVLTVIFQFANHKSLLFAKDVVFECSRQLRYQLCPQEPILLLLSAVSKYLRRNFKQENANTIDSIDPVKHINDSLFGRLKSFLKHKSKKEDDFEQTTSSEFSTNEREEEIDIQSKAAVPEPDPVHVQVAHEIIRNCIYHLPSSFFKNKIYCLISAENCFELLAAETSGNHLLPMVHQMWSPVVNRLKDDKSVVVMKSFRLIVLFSHLSRDFVRRKISGDCVKPLLDAFERLSNMFVTLLKSAAAKYEKTTNDFKLLMLLIEKLPSLLIDCKIVPWDRKETFTLVKLVVKFSMEFENIDKAVSDKLNSAKEELKLQDSSMVQLLELASKNK